MISKKTVLIYLIVSVLSALCVSSVHAWEAPIVIAAKNNHSYVKPEIGFGPSGAVYIVYREKHNPTGNSDIYLTQYDGKKLVTENVSQLASQWAKYKAYESDIAVDADERVHVVWIAHEKPVKTTHHIMYRYRDGSTWSQVYNLGALHVPEDDTCFDTRLGVDNSGNVHVVTYIEDDKTTWYVAKYGDILLPVVQLGPIGKKQWVKHPDLAVTDDYVHVIWQQKKGFPYVIMHHKWENRVDAAKGMWEQVTFPEEPWANQKSRIDIDSDGLAHFAIFYKTGDPKKLNYWREMPDGSYNKIRNLSDPQKLRLYHFGGLEVRDNSIIVTMQLGDDLGGQGIYYNWQKNGVWSEYTRIPGTENAAHQSTDLTMDGEIAAVAFARRDTEIALISSAPISATGLLEVQFSHPATVFSGSEITFDASPCTTLNPDYTIVQYDWNFGDGIIHTTSSPTYGHTFTTYGGDVEITLTITADTGETGEGSQIVRVHALYGGIITAVNAKRIRTLFFDRLAYELTWTANPKNTDAGYPTITSYEIWRAPETAVVSDADYILIGEVDAGVHTFLDYFGPKPSVNYLYAIRSIDSEGHISPFNNL